MIPMSMPFGHVLHWNTTLFFGTHLGIIRVRDTLEQGVKLQAKAPHVRCLHTPSMVWSETLHEDPEMATTIRLKSQVTQHEEILAGKTPGLFPVLADRDICCLGRGTSMDTRLLKPSRTRSRSNTGATPSNPKRSGSAGTPRLPTPCLLRAQALPPCPTSHPPHGTHASGPRL